jgi:hypothetical protein
MKRAECILCAKYCGDVVEGYAQLPIILKREFIFELCFYIKKYLWQWVLDSIRVPALRAPIFLGICMRNRMLRPPPGYRTFFLHPLVANTKNKNVTHRWGKTVEAMSIRNLYMQNLSLNPRTNKAVAIRRWNWASDSYYIHNFVQKQ